MFDLSLCKVNLHILGAKQRLEAKQLFEIDQSAAILNIYPHVSVSNQGTK